MKTIFISIAGFNIKVVFDSSINPLVKTRLTSDIRSFFANFISDSESSFDTEIKVVDLPSPTDETMQVINGRRRYVYFYKNLSKKKIETYYQISLFQFQIIVQNILHQLLARHKGFIFHASASEIDNKAYLFSGNSGAGKSTVVKLLSNSFHTLSDDFSLIREVNGRYFFFQHPFPEKNYVANKKSSGYEIGKLFFLKKSEDLISTKALSKEKVMSLLIGQLISPQSGSAETLMEFASEFEHYYILNFIKEEKKMLEFFNTS